MADRLAAIRAVLALPCPAGMDPVAWRRAQEAVAAAPVTAATAPWPYELPAHLPGPCRDTAPCDLSPY
jgi:hypothetical protein